MELRDIPADLNAENQERLGASLKQQTQSTRYYQKITKKTTYHI